MNEIITREFINKNIKYVDYEKDFEYDYETLSRTIDAFKNLLQKHGVDGTSTKSLVIGLQPSLAQTACIFACFELAVKICIIDYSRDDEFDQYEYMDPKTEQLTPIDLFISKTNSDVGKRRFFSKICEHSIFLDEEIKDYTPNHNIFCTPDSVIMKCTSSGTTGTPKVVEHTHKFLYHLAIRNTVFYHANCALLYNLNHGSSFATYFLPVIHNDSTSKIYNIFTEGREFCESDIKIVGSFLKNIDHILVSYSDNVEHILKKGHPNLNIYTLSSIPQRWKRFNKRKANDVISFFGSNETSGPVLINKLSSNNFNSDRYFVLDNFYKIEINEGTLHVPLPYYDNVVIDTKDMFVQINNDSYKFLGRDDLTKINGNIIKKSEFEKVVKHNKIKSFDLIYDIHENLIYLAIWQDVPDVDEKINIIVDKIKLISNNRNTIGKYAVLDKSEFLTGVKIDHELLRHYFRKYVKDSN